MSIRWIEFYTLAGIDFSVIIFRKSCFQKSHLTIHIKGIRVLFQGLHQMKLGLFKLALFFINRRHRELGIGIDKGVPCGLIVNELISNSLKHAFPGKRKGRITVEIGEVEGRVRIVVKDNGKGFPEEIDFRNTETLGLELVTTLTAQIEGEIELDRARGTTFTIEFVDEGRSDGEGLSGSAGVGGGEA